MRCRLYSNLILIIISSSDMYTFLFQTLTYFNSGQKGTLKNMISTRSWPTDGLKDRRTDRCTDRQTDIPSYRDARTHLKILSKKKLWAMFRQKSIKKLCHWRDHTEISTKVDRQNASNALTNNFVWLSKEGIGSDPKTWPNCSCLKILIEGEKFDW